jgi:molybdopterin molybdotransferase
MTLLPVEEARGRVLGRVTPLEAEPVEVGPGLAGRVTAEPVVASHDLPPFANSAMDGYAVCSAEAAGPLPVAGRLSAGDAPRLLPEGAALRIATGAPVPDGADAVVPIERAREENGRVAFEGQVRPGDNVREAGDDVPAGSEVVAAGVRLDPLTAAAVAATGVASVLCARRPRVAVLVTGDELLGPGDPPRPGAIHESNSVLVAARCAALGADVAPAVRVADDLEATVASFGKALETADVVIGSGGVSVGPADYVKPALRSLGVEELFWRVAIQPGRPLWAGVRGRTLVFGLPGNPLSVLAGLELIVRPSLGALLGRAPAPPRQARLAAAVSRRADRARVLPARLRGDAVEPLAAGLSHHLVRAAGADALAVVPAGPGEAAAGDVVEVVPLDAT